MPIPLEPPNLPLPDPNTLSSSENADKITALTTAINALPPAPIPLNALTLNLGEAVYGLLKIDLASVASTNPTSDPKKIFAYGIALIIIQFLWCMIKNFLHSLPIIGSFVDPCTPEGTSPDLNRSNISLNSVIRPIQITTQSITTIVGNTPPPPPPPPVQNPVAPIGKTFNDFVRANPAPGPAVPVQEQATTTATTTNIQQNDYQRVPNNNNDDQRVRDELRRMFGL